MYSSKETVLSIFNVDATLFDTLDRNRKIKMMVGYLQLRVVYDECICILIKVYTKYKN